MKQIFITGASTVYGVGGSAGGWADMLKRHLHALQYAGSEEFHDVYEVYNFARPGMTLEDTRQSFVRDIRYRKQTNAQIFAILSVGANDARALSSPHAYVSTVAEYSHALQDLFDQVKKETRNIIFVGFTPVDESRTTPIENPVSGGESYFTNERLREFDRASQALAEKNRVNYISLFAEARGEDWSSYLRPNGLHVNDQGHDWIYERVIAAVENFFELR